MAPSCRIGRVSDRPFHSRTKTGGETEEKAETRRSQGAVRYIAQLGLAVGANRFPKSNSQKARQIRESGRIIPFRQGI